MMMMMHLQPALATRPSSQPRLLMLLMIALVIVPPLTCSLNCSVAARLGSLPLTACLAGVCRVCVCGSLSVL